MTELRVGEVGVLQEGDRPPEHLRVHRRQVHAEQFYVFDVDIPSLVDPLAQCSQLVLGELREGEIDLLQSGDDLSQGTGLHVLKIRCLEACLSQTAELVTLELLEKRVRLEWSEFGKC